CRRSSSRTCRPGSCPRPRSSARARTVSPSGSPTSTCTCSALPTTARPPRTLQGMRDGASPVSSTSTSSPCPRCRAGCRGGGAAGVRSGAYDQEKRLPAEPYKRLPATTGVKTFILKPYYEIFMHLNTQNGQLKEWKLRRAIQVGLNQEEIMLAAAGDKALYRL